MLRVIEHVPKTQGWRRRKDPKNQWNLDASMHQKFNAKWVVLEAKIQENREKKTIPKTIYLSHAFFYRFHWIPPGGGHRRLPICVQESWGTAMPLRLACAGLQCWRHMGKWKPTFWLHFGQTWRSWQETCGTRVFPENVGLEVRKSRPGGYKIISGGSQIEARTVQNRARSPPRRNF